jgi:hypothetical protein
MPALRDVSMLVSFKIASLVLKIKCLFLECIQAIHRS